MAISDKNNEEEIIGRAKLGDEDAIAWLYQANVDRIYRYIVYRVPEQDAQDLTADVFIKMLEGLSRFTYTGAPFEAWLYKIAHARVADYHRKRVRNGSEDVTEEFTDTTLQPEEFLLAKQEFKQVREALSKLTDIEQTILILRFVEQKSHEEVADIVTRSHAAVRTMQHRALHKLAQHLNADTKERHYLRGVTPPRQNELDSD